MAASISTPADMINLAFAKIGFKGRVGSLYEGSAPAKKALDIYAQTRDAVLRSDTWGFAEKIAAAALSGNVAPSPWSIEYSYPTDGLEIRNIFNAAYLADKNNPLPVLYTIGNNASGAKIIWANASGATLVYTAQITDPTKWEPLFIELFAIELGKRLAPSLASPDMAKLLMEDEKTAVPLAEGIVG